VFNLLREWILYHSLQILEQLVSVLLLPLLALGAIGVIWYLRIQFKPFFQLSKAFNTKTGIS